MFSIQVIFIVVVGYMALLFLLARWGEKAGKNPKSIVNGPIVYSLALAVYCTSWTYYGSVGAASQSGILFLAIYIGTTLSISVWWIILRKLVRIKNNYKITSIADFISARFDKSETVGLLAALIALFGAFPYIALQLKSIINTVSIMTGNTDVLITNGVTPQHTISIIIIMMLSIFIVVFGFKHLDSSKKHNGMLLSLALESIVKLVAFITVGVFITYYLNNGITDILTQYAAQRPIGESDFLFLNDSSFKFKAEFLSYMLLSFSAVLFLPRQFHVAVIENSNEEHIKTASWLFPLYLCLINIFVIPIAFGGILSGESSKLADQFVLLLPMKHNAPWLTLLTFIGGFSAAASMIMVSTVTISTIISNHILMPIFRRVTFLSFLSRQIIFVRWVSSISLILLSYAYAILIGKHAGLVSMGIISFVAALQFMPVVFAGIYLKSANKGGAILGLLFGLSVWLYTLFIPAFMKIGILPDSILQHGPFGIELLKPEALFGIDIFRPVSHSVVWSMFFNILGLYIGSAFFDQSESERKIFDQFFSEHNIFNLDEREFPRVIDLQKKFDVINNIFLKYIPFQDYLLQKQSILDRTHLNNKRMITIVELSELANTSEAHLAGIIGAPNAHIEFERSELITQKEKQELANFYGKYLVKLNISPNELNKQIFYYKEKEKVIKQYANELERSLELTSKDLEEQKGKSYNASKLASLGEMAAGIAHEINNPLTIIQACNTSISKQIDRGQLNPEKTKELLNKSNETILRISKIIKSLRNISRNSEQDTFQTTTFREIFDDILPLCVEKFNSHGVKFSINQNDDVFKKEFLGQRIQLSQVFINMLNNAYDAIEPIETKWINVQLSFQENQFELIMEDCGNGISPEIEAKIFQPFFTTKEIGKGTGLGLSLSSSIIKHHGGSIMIDRSVPNTRFKIFIPFFQDTPRENN